MSKRAEPGERPPAPWGSFPLAELTILGGIVMLAIGIVSGSPTALAVGVVLGALGGLEVSVREHFAGYRSHSTLLSGFAFVVAVGALLYFAGATPPVGVAAGAVVFLAAFVSLRRAFRRASGGLSYRLGGFRG